MAAKVVINFRDNTFIEFSKPSVKGYRVVYREGVVSIVDPFEAETSYPLDTVKSIYEEPQPRW